MSENTSKKGLNENLTRYTVIMKEDLLNDLKDYAWTERVTMKDAVNKMVSDFLADKEFIRRGDDER